MGLSIVAVVLAVVLPLGIVRFRRPELICVWAPPEPVIDDWCIHLRIINKPIPFPFGLLLMRNTATACQARLTFHWTSIRRRAPFLAREARRRDGRTETRRHI